MSKSWYSRSGKSWQGFRELEDDEKLKPGDIIWSKRAEYMRIGTNIPAYLVLGKADHLTIFVTPNGKDLTLVRACEIVDMFMDAYAPAMLAQNIIIPKRLYSLWRKKIILPPNPSSQPLPLP